LGAAAALVLLVLVAKGEEGPATVAMAGAVREAVLVDAQIDLREVASVPKDDEAIALARDVHATAVVELVWHEKHRRVTLHFHADPSQKWTDRHLTFEATDSDADRGRTIGFAVVSMLPETLTRPPPLPPPSTQPPTPPPEPPIDAPEHREAEKPRERWKPEDFVPERHVGALDLAASMRAGADASGYGATLSGRWDLATRWSARGVLAVHAGNVPEASASSLVGTVGAGVVARPILATRVRPFELAFRADFLVQRVELAHDAAGGGTVSESRWNPAFDVAIDGEWVFAGNFGVFVALGGELAFGKTAVFVAGSQVATIAPLRAVGDAGFRLFF
jgi:hypothetical protein